MGGDNHGRRGGSRRVIPRGANGWQARSIAADAGAVQGGRRRDGAAVRASTRCVPSIRRIKTRSAPWSLPRARDASRNETNHRKPTNIPPRRRKKPARRDRRLTPRSLLFSVHAGARAEGIRAKRRKSGYQLRVTVPVVEDPAADAPTAEEPTATKEEQAARGVPGPDPGPARSIRPDAPASSGSDSLDDALAATTRPKHLAALDFGPGCDACAATGEPGDRRVVATRSIARGECVVFEAPVAAVKAGEPVASDVLAAAFCGDAIRRDGLLGGVNSDPAEVERVREVFGDLPVIINLIDVNDSREDGFRRATSDELDAFRDALARSHTAFRRRYSGGRDKHAACGMLAATHQRKSESESAQG